VEKSETCPFFKDYVRECMEHIHLVSDVCTLIFCLNKEEYNDCPFFRVIKSIEPLCENIDKCQYFKKLSLTDFKKFIMETQTYCFSKKRIDCARYIQKSQGLSPSPDLAPDGSMLN